MWTRGTDASLRSSEARKAVEEEESWLPSAGPHTLLHTPISWAALETSMPGHTLTSHLMNLNYSVWEASVGIFFKDPRGFRDMAELGSTDLEKGHNSFVFWLQQTSSACLSLLSFLEMYPHCCTSINNGAK